MLSIKELEFLIELLNKKEETLERVEEIFLSKFKDSEGVFRASYALANLLNLNVHVIVCSCWLRCKGYQQSFCLSRTTKPKELTIIRSGPRSSK